MYFSYSFTCKGEESMKQLHKQFSDEEIKQYLKWYETRVMTKSEILTLLGIKNSRFYVLLARYRDKPKVS